MPIGVPRIIYCWGEELPAQWTDIYNFIFRRRMVFLMQYLDDELCNQICGLLINIHMEDRSKELEKKEMERSGVFKSTSNTKTKSSLSADTPRAGASRESRDSSFGKEREQQGFYNKKSRSMEDLLNADEDLGIDDIDTLEQYTLQKITAEWLNWNAQFFDYADEPYLFYLAELLSKDFNQNEANMGQQYSNGFLSSASSYTNESKNQEISQFLNLIKQNASYMKPNFTSSSLDRFQNSAISSSGFSAYGFGPSQVYSPFRTHANYSVNDLSLYSRATNSGNGGENSSNFGREGSSLSLLKMFQEYQNQAADKNIQQRYQEKTGFLRKLLAELSQKDLLKNFSSSRGSLAQRELPKGNQAYGQSNLSQLSEKAMGQRNLRREFNFENRFPLWPEAQRAKAESLKSYSYLDSSITGANKGSREEGNFSNYSEFRDYYRKQTERTLIEEESKKVFVIINSFGGSVGNGITVHDALQFIKAGSLTLALGVAASAASLALAGGTIGERYVTEGCHVMIHQPEGGLQGQASDIWIDSQEIMKIRLDVAEIYSLSTYRPRHKVLRDLDRDFYLTATETIHYGLADEIATNEVMHSILEMTNNAWNYDNSKQERLLDSRVNIIGNSVQTQEST